MYSETSITDKVFQGFKLYLTSYCLSDFVYSHSDGLVKTETKSSNYIKDINLAEDFMNKISDAIAVIELESVARKINYNLKKQKK